MRDRAKTRMGENREVVKLLDRARAKISREHLEFFLKEFSKSIENYPTNFFSFRIRNSGELRIDWIRSMKQTLPNNSGDVANWQYFPLLFYPGKKLRRNIFLLYRYILCVWNIRMYGGIGSILL